MTDTEATVEPAPTTPTALAKKSRRASPPSASPSAESASSTIDATGPTAPPATPAPATAVEEPVLPLAAETPPATGKRTRRHRIPAVSGFPWEVSPLSKVPTEALVKEVDRRRRRAGALVAEGRRLRAELARIDVALAAMNVAIPRQAAAIKPQATAKARSPRAKNDVTLTDAIAMAVEVRATVTPAEAAKLVLANGYKTTSKTFNISVATTLAKDARFERIGRGNYRRTR